MSLTGMFRTSAKSDSDRLLTTFEVPKIVSLLADLGHMLELGRGRCALLAVASGFFSELLV